MFSNIGHCEIDGVYHSWHKAGEEYVKNAQDVFCAKGQLFPLLDISDGVNFKSVLVRSEAKKNWLLTSDPRCSNVVAMANPTIS